MSVLLENAQNLDRAAVPRRSHNFGSYQNIIQVLVSSFSDDEDRRLRIIDPRYWRTAARFKKGTSGKVIKELIQVPSITGRKTCPKGFL